MAPWTVDTWAPAPLRAGRLAVGRVGCTLQEKRKTQGACVRAWCVTDRPRTARPTEKTFGAVGEVFTSGVNLVSKFSPMPPQTKGGNGNGNGNGSSHELM